jgi:hypothetical protein
MASAIVSEPTDKIAAVEEWMVGVVDLGPDHVYGLTALTPAEWTLLDILPRRDGRPHGQLLLDERCCHSCESLRIARIYDTHVAANERIHHLIEFTPGAFWPTSGPIRLVLTEVTR